MYPITNEIKALFESEQRKVLRITGTDKNGATISITDNNVMADSFQIDRYACNGEKLEVGTAIAAQLTLKLENGNGQYDGIVFEGTELFVEVGIADWTQSSPTVTYIPCGYFTPDEQPRRLSTISITALDRMTKFDAVVDGTQIATPITVANLVARVCTLRGVTLAQSITGLTNANVSLPSIPSGNSVTYRNLIAWCAGIMGTNAWIDWNGQLRFSWYNNATGYASTVDNRYSSDMYENDLTVTGVVYTTTGGIDIVEGTDDYALDLTGNTLATPMFTTILPALNTALNGFSYRPFTAAAVNAPYLWPMDAVTFTDKEGNNHASLLTNVCFGLNGTTAMEARGMTYVLNRQKLPEGWTKEQAQLINEFNNSLNQQDIFNRLTENGAAQGLVLYDGQLYVNASYINAGYLSAARIKGDTLTLGGANNINGTMQVLDANGNIVVTLNNDGADIVNGSLVTYDDNRTTRTRLTEGRISFDFYNDIVSPPFWLSVANISHSNDANLLIQGSNTVKITNLSGGADTDRAEIEMDDDSISLRSINTIDGNVTIDVGLDGVSFTIDDFVGGPYVFKLMKNTSSNPLSVGNGGTGANSAAGARANLGVNDIGTVQAQSAINLVTDGQVYSITITKDCWVCASFHIIASTDGTAMLWRNNIPVIKNEHTNGACNYWANAQFPCRAGGLLQYQLNTNATDSNIYFLTV